MDQCAHRKSQHLGWSSRGVVNESAWLDGFGFALGMNPSQHMVCWQEQGPRKGGRVACAGLGVRGSVGGVRFAPSHSLLSSQLLQRCSHRCLVILPPEATKGWMDAHRRLDVGSRRTCSDADLVDPNSTARHLRPELGFGGFRTARS